MRLSIRSAHLSPRQHQESTPLRVAADLYDLPREPRHESEARLPKGSRTIPARKTRRLITQSVMDLFGRPWRSLASCNGAEPKSCPDGRDSAAHISSLAGSDGMAGNEEVERQRPVRGTPN